MAPIKFEPGQTVSHFRIEKMLGEGGMGAVYLAEDLTLSRRVAIKFMHRSLLVQQGNETTREGLEKRFIREAKSAAAINHPNLAQIYEANFDSDSWFIAMEFIDGASLYDLLTDGKKFAVNEIISICRQVVSGLEFAWENYKIIHRDIKPHNIMLTKNKLVKIVDLGLAKPLSGDDTQYELPDLTCAGTPIGTPQYMAPEQATGQKDVNYSADIFALGATLYEVLTGKKAFTGNTAPMIYMAQIQKKYVPLKEVSEKFPEGLVTLIESMMEPKPEERILSYQEINEKLNQIDVDPVSNKPLTVRSQSFTRPVSTYSGQFSSKTIGIEQMTVYHPTDKLIKDRYRILKPIGKSRAGMVYHCLDTKLSVECVVKSIFPGREYPEYEMGRVIENFQRLMGLSHPNLVQIRDLQLDDETGEFFVVMELLVGRNLREYTHRLRNEIDTLDIQAITPVLSNIAKALDAVSKTFNLIHHDLIPEKIYLLKNDTQVKFLDYGITYPSSESRDQFKAEELYKYPMATPDYMSPEHWQRKTVSRQSDQYSFAVIIYEMLAEKLPFWLKDILELEDTEKHTDSEDKLTESTPYEKQLQNLFTRVLSEAPPPLAFLKRHENAALVKALSKDPHGRFTSCEEFIKILSRKEALSTGMKASLISAAALVLVGSIAYPLVNKKSKSSVETNPSVNGQVKTISEMQFKPPGTNTQMNREKEEPKSKPPIDQIADSKAKDPTAPVANNGKQKKETISDPKKPILTTAMNPIAGKPSEEDRKSKTLEQQVHCSKLKLEFTNLRKSLPKDPDAMELLKQTDERIQKADEFFANGNYNDSISAYKEAISLAQSIPEQVKKIKEIRLAEEKSEAINLKRTFLEQREDSLKNEKARPFYKDIDRIAESAENFLENEEYTSAIVEFKKAIDSTHELSNKMKLEAKNEAAKLQESARELRDQLNNYKGLSAEITEKIVKFDVLLSIAKESIKKEEFSLAVSQLNTVIQNGTSVLEIAQDKFQANVGKGFADPKTGMEFVWLEDLNFWIGKYEVTNAEFKKFRPTHDSKKSMGFSLNKDYQPVLEVSYYDAVGFCEWLNAVSLPNVNAPEHYIYRLPSREEWQTVARCGEERLYPWGNAWPPKYGNYGNQEIFPSTWDLEGYTDEFPVTCDVRKSGGNEWAVFGLAGNVWEWTTDLHDDKRAVIGGDWTSVNRATLIIGVQGSNAPMDEPFDNIGFRVLLAKESK